MNAKLKNSYELSIFCKAPDSLNDTAWARHILLEVVAPFTDRFKDKLEWFWFCRCYPQKKSYRRPSGRHVMLRFNAKGKSLKSIKAYLEKLIKKADCLTYGVKSYSVLGDLASQRFSPKSLPKKKKIERAQLITTFFCSLSRVVLSCLYKNHDGTHDIEHCPHELHNSGLMLESMLHLFCNITSISTDIFVVKKKGSLNIVGPWDLKNSLKNGWKVKEKKLVRF
ncbi:MAG: hypothetical protein ABIH57_03650 [Candidatus Omnitrophota bacterium]